VFVTSKARKLLENHFPDELKDFDPDRKPYRRRKVWVDPNDRAFDFLKKYDKKEGSQAGS